jgi:hypothetical protein
VDEIMKIVGEAREPPPVSRPVKGFGWEGEEEEHLVTTAQNPVLRLLQLEDFNSSCYTSYTWMVFCKFLSFIVIISRP